MSTESGGTLTTYKLANGDLWADEYSFVTDLDGWTDDPEEAFNVIEEVWVRQSMRIIHIAPKCRDFRCDEDAEFWGLCEAHAREDDPEYFATVDGLS